MATTNSSQELCSASTSSPDSASIQPTAAVNQHQTIPPNATHESTNLGTEYQSHTPATSAAASSSASVGSLPSDEWRSFIAEAEAAQPLPADLPGEDNYRSTYLRTEVNGGVKYTHPTAGQTFGRAKTRWERAYAENQAKRKGNRWGIFVSERQWQIAFWMGMTKTSQRSLDELLKTHIFQACKEIISDCRKKMALFGGPIWHEVEVTLDDAPADTHILWYRDLEAVLDDLMGRPTLSGKMTYAPEIHHDSDDKTRRYSNVWTAKRWNRLQGAVPPGTTIGGVMIASDSTQLSTHSGNVSAHAVYVTLANIDKSMRNQTSQDAWALVAYIPVSKFPVTMLTHEEKSKDYRTKLLGLLNRRLLHRCLSIVTRPLRRTIPHRVAGSDGFYRGVIYKLMAYIADFEEQTRLTGIGSRSCPHCMATAKDLGDVDDKTPQTSASILQAIDDVKKVLSDKYPGDRYDAMDFLKECKAFGLNGVDKPFWRLIPDADICEILSPDLLHRFHKFFYDHIFEWNTLTLGENEMDVRMRSQIPLTGDRSFHSGVSHLSQTTMKEHRDLQRVHMAVMSGAPATYGRRVAAATRSILDCIYLAQYTSHSSISLDAYRQTYREFHRRKQVWLDNKSRLGKDAMRKEAKRRDENEGEGEGEGESSVKENARNHFNIPKLHILRHLADHVELKGTADNYTTEAMEHLHIDLVKNAYRASNRRNWKEQTTRWLTRREKLKDFAAWMEWCGKDGTSIEDTSAIEQDWADEDGDDEQDDGFDDLPGEEPGSLPDSDGAAVYADEDGNIPGADDDPQRIFKSLWFELDDASEEEDLREDADTQDIEPVSNEASALSGANNEQAEKATLGKRKRGKRPVIATDPWEPQVRPRKPAAAPAGLTPLQMTRLTPQKKKLSIQDAMEKYGAPDLLTELKRHSYAATLATLPDQYTHIDTWPFIRVQPPPRQHAPAAGLQRVRVQCLQLDKPSDNRPSNLGASDSVMYLNEPGIPSSTTRIHDCSVGQLTLLFRLSPSIFNPDPPLLAYIHRFTRIPQQPDAEAGMYIVKKDRRTNGQLFGRVIEARQIVRLCPLAPVIHGVANRQVTPRTSFSFYESFYINKYHSHELYEYLHVI
ncbi:hypothetical protein RSOLAG22IIIB_06827 [Rhizoctonia solani]|uniref:Uncharacterized protein n=1 Tax=Rhizoctonia solani TaxID=456999 RepID=A0A0K6GHK3_9AGAM|nr:hypothetical protein RSOLAG22IIIB_06827 [Rhizoctonia solani]